MPESLFWQSIAPLWVTQEINQNGPTLYRLPKAQLISITGPDAEKFMQGQFTCDLRQVTADQSAIGACCNLKGRMLAQFQIVRVDNESYLLRCPIEVATEFIAHLNKYKVFFKCELTLPGTVGCFGVCGDESVLQNVLGPLPAKVNQTKSREDLTIIRVAGEQPRFELWTKQGEVSRWLPTALQHCRQGNDDEWELLEIRAGIGEVYSSTREEFIPQMLNLQSLGGISFKKGCYTGQEIVARMQYLGKLKKRMYLIAIDTAANSPVSEPGDKLVDSEQKNVGIVVRSAANTVDQHLALAVLDKGTVEGNKGLYFKKNLKATCHIHELPYQVDIIGDSRPGR